MASGASAARTQVFVRVRPAGPTPGHKMNTKFAMSVDGIGLSCEAPRRASQLSPIPSTLIANLVFILWPGVGPAGLTLTNTCVLAALAPEAMTVTGARAPSAARWGQTGGSHP